MQSAFTQRGPVGRKVVVGEEEEAGLSAYAIRLKYSSDNQMLP